MSSVRIRDLPDSTGVLSSDNLIISSSSTTYKASISETKSVFISQTSNTRGSSLETNYNITSSDISNIVNINKTIASTITIPASVSNASNIGDYIDIINSSSTNSDVRILAEPGIYIRSFGNHKDLVSQYQSCKATKFSATEWLLSGNLYTSPSGTFLMEKPNQKLEELSSKIINQAGLSGDPEYGSVIIILMFISITIGCIRAIQECNKNKMRDMSQEDRVKFMKDQIRKMSRRKSWFSKMRIRKILRREMEANQYKKHGAAIVDAILHTGDRITDDEVLSIMEALNV